MPHRGSPVRGQQQRAPPPQHHYRSGALAHKKFPSRVCRRSGDSQSSLPHAISNYAHHRDVPVLSHAGRQRATPLSTLHVDCKASHSDRIDPRWPRCSAFSRVLSTLARIQDRHPKAETLNLECHSLCFSAHRGETVSSWKLHRYKRLRRSDAYR